jgi:hypothetical protein
VEAKTEGMARKRFLKKKAFRKEGKSLSNHSLQKKDKGGLGWIK